MILSSQVKQKEYSLNTWYAEVDSATSLKDLLQPEYWSHVARKYAEKDRIEVWKKDLSMCWDLVVVGVGKNYLHVAKVAEHKVDMGSGDEFDGLDIKLRGPKKWSVIRKSDNEVLIEGLSKVEAEEWARDHNKKAV